MSRLAIEGDRVRWQSVEPGAASQFGVVDAVEGDFALVRPHSFQNGAWRAVNLSGFRLHVMTLSVVRDFGEEGVQDDREDDLDG